jgi:hypothetical protein
MNNLVTPAEIRAASATEQVSVPTSKFVPDVEICG